MNLRNLSTLGVTHFLPPVALMMLGIPIVADIVGGHAPLTTLRDLNLPLLVADPFLVTAGYILGLCAMRGRLEEAPLRKWWPHLSSSIVSMLALIIVTFMAQGAHLPKFVLMSMSAGLLGALVIFGPLSSVRMSKAVGT